MARMSFAGFVFCRVVRAADASVAALPELMGWRHNRLAARGMSTFVTDATYEPKVLANGLARLLFAQPGDGTLSSKISLEQNRDPVLGVLFQEALYRSNELCCGANGCFRLKAIALFGLRRPSRLPRRANYTHVLQVIEPKQDRRIHADCKGILPEDLRFDPDGGVVCGLWRAAQGTGAPAYRG